MPLHSLVCLAPQAPRPSTLRVPTEISTPVVFGHPFNFTQLRSRGHYTATPEMRAYFKAVHYLTTLAAKDTECPAEDQRC